MTSPYREETQEAEIRKLQEENKVLNKVNKKLETKLNKLTKPWLTAPKAILLICSGVTVYSAIAGLCYDAGLLNTGVRTAVVASGVVTGFGAVVATVIKFVN